jgi:myo-inositol-1(or 4)-monophosphatase
MSPGEQRALAEAVAREAGALLREAFAGPALRVAAKSSPTDPVSDADRAAERLIRDRLEAARPDDAILGEEGGDTAGTSGVRWIVDPLDGTVNFLFCIPHWGVSVACEDADGPLAGVVYDPMRDEVWAAERESRALLNGVPVHASPRQDLATALVATGFGYHADARRAQALLVARVLPAVRDIRRLGSAALDLAWTRRAAAAGAACGRRLSARGARRSGGARLSARGAAGLSGLRADALVAWPKARPGRTLAC